jgi:two-component system OmpR family response regulator
MMQATAIAPQSAILVVDDDTELRDHVAGYLAAFGFEVGQAGNGREMDAALQRRGFDLVILDVMLPDEDGLAICRRLASADGPAILMLSAMGGEVDRILGLELGADGYVSKPCSPRELLAHVRAVLRRRSAPRSGAAPTTMRETIGFEGFAMDLSRRQLTAPNGAVVLLTVAEFALLRAFLQSPKRIVSREALAAAASGEDAAFVESSIEVLVSRLRRKLYVEGRDELIRTYRGEGYLFDATPAD